jgi:hypothetical protein
VTGTLGIQGLDRAVENIRYSTEIRLGTISFKNWSRARSKEVEITFQNGFGWGESAIDGPNQPRAELKLKSIEPGGTATVYFISRGWYSFSGTPISVIHDNIRVDVHDEQIADYLPFYRAVVINKIPASMVVSISPLISSDSTQPPATNSKQT